MQISTMKASEEASYYHGSKHFGYAAILQRTAQGMRQTCRLMDHLFSALDCSAGKTDIWVSQGEFSRPNRRLINLLRIGIFFVDLDTYRVGYTNESPEELTRRALHECYVQELPPPTFVVFSGCGLQLKWALESPVPRDALPRWNLIQKTFIDRLQLLGADAAASDASRVLRVPNTINSKSGKVCCVTHFDSQNIYSFEWLASELLPVTRSEIEKKRKRQITVVNNATVNTTVNTERLKLWGNLTPFSHKQLAWDRLNDLRTLQELRGGVIPEGQRMINLFWQLVFLLTSEACSPSGLWHEAAAVARDICPNWKHNSRELITLYHKAKAYRAGERIEFAGQLKLPIYTPKNDYLINLLQITDTEQSNLKTIISSSVSQERTRERDRKRDEVRRRKAGAISRAEYLQQADDKRGQILALREQGFSVRKIAEKLGVSKSHVGRIIKN